MKRQVLTLKITIKILLGLQGTVSSERKKGCEEDADNKADTAVDEVKVDIGVLLMNY